MLRRVLENLLENSATHSPPGTTIRLSCRSEKDGVALCVADEGPGIPDADREAIFDGAARAGRDLVGSGRQGLGLAVCRMGGEAHRGWRRVERNGSRGRCFVVTLPCEVG